MIVLKHKIIKMSVLFILIGISIVIAIGFLFAFIWSVKTGQYDDDYTPSVRILFENTPNSEKNPEQTLSHKDNIPEKKTIPPLIN